MFWLTLSHLRDRLRRGPHEAAAVARKPAEAARSGLAQQRLRIAVVVPVDALLDADVLVDSDVSAVSVVASAARAARHVSDQPRFAGLWRPARAPRARQLALVHLPALHDVLVDSCSRTLWRPIGALRRLALGHIGPYGHVHVFVRS